MGVRLNKHLGWIQGQGIGLFWLKEARYPSKRQIKSSWINFPLFGLRIYFTDRITKPLTKHAYFGKVTS